MTNRRTFSLLIPLLGLLFSVKAHSNWWFSNNDNDDANTDISELEWEDLIPEGFVQPENPFISMSQEEIDKLMDGTPESQAKIAQLQAQFNYAPIVPELDGRRVKIPAYVTPLEYNSDSLIKEFLLVPYVGACIHTPPPPANQIVHAISPEAIKLESTYDPIWAVGIIRAESVKSELAESGYRLDVEKIMPYTQR